jgi:hypothetical protein
MISNSKKEEIISKYLSTPQGVRKLAQAMMNPTVILCPECGMSFPRKAYHLREPGYEPKIPDSHTREECDVYSVVGS